MTKREIRRHAKRAIGQLLFNSNWAELFDATELPEEAREGFIEAIHDIGWRLQEQVDSTERRGQ